MIRNDERIAIENQKERKKKKRGEERNVATTEVAVKMARLSKEIALKSEFALIHVVG